MLVNNSEKKESKIPYQRVRQFVYKIIKRRVQTSEDAEDITQNVLIRGWQSNEKNSDRLNFETEEDFLRYFSVIAVNEVKRFQSEQNKSESQKTSEDVLINLAAQQLSPEYCLEIIQAICQLPLKQRLTLILGHQKLLGSFQTVFSTKTIAEMLEINETLLEKLANEIPLNDEDIKSVIEIIMENKLKTSVRDERWKARKVLKGIIYRS